MAMDTYHGGDFHVNWIPAYAAILAFAVVCIICMMHSVFADRSLRKSREHIDPMLKEAHKPRWGVYNLKTHSLLERERMEASRHLEAGIPRNYDNVGLPARKDIPGTEPSRKPRRGGSGSGSGSGRSSTKNETHHSETINIGIDRAVYVEGIKGGSSQGKDKSKGKGRGRDRGRGRGRETGKEPARARPITQLVNDRRMSTGSIDSTMAVAWEPVTPLAGAGPSRLLARPPPPPPQRVVELAVDDEDEDLTNEMHAPTQPLTPRKGGWI